MFIYEKKLQYPVKIANPNPKYAQIIISQYGGPDGELGASLRYLSQRYSMPYAELKGLLTDIGTEELGHLEMIGAIVHQLTRNLTPEEIKAVPAKVLAGYSEELHLGLWLHGNRVEGSWAHPDEASSVYELKAYTMAVLQRLGISLGGLLMEEGANDIFSKSLAVKDRNGKLYLELGLVSKALTSACDIDGDVFFAELNWTLLMKKLPKKVQIILWKTKKAQAKKTQKKTVKKQKKMSMSRQKSRKK